METKVGSLGCWTVTISVLSVRGSLWRCLVFIIVWDRKGRGLV